MSLEAYTAVWSRSKAQGTTLLVHLALADCANDAHRGWCWPGIDYIAKKSRLSRRSVCTKLQELEDIGEVYTDHYAGPNCCNRYLLLLVSGGKVTEAPHAKEAVQIAPVQTSAHPENNGESETPVQGSAPVQDLHDANCMGEIAHKPSGTEGSPLSGPSPSDSEEALPEFPGEAEVLTFGRAYAGNLAKGIPAAIPDLWLHSHWGWRTFDEEFWPKNWKEALVWKFELDWTQGHPKARGALAVVKKNGNGVWAVKQRLEQLKSRCATHPANEASAAYCGDPSPGLVAEFENLQQEIQKCSRQLEGAT